MNSSDILTKEQILAALARLNELLHESPAAFRVRDLFVSANALHRA